MPLMDDYFLEYPFKVVRKMTVWLKEKGRKVNYNRAFLLGAQETVELS